MISPLTALLVVLCHATPYIFALTIPAPLALSLLLSANTSVTFSSNASNLE